MFGNETRRGLAPRSWTAVSVWLVLIAVTVAYPLQTLGVVFNSVVGAGRWVGYAAFAACDDPPPYDWMQPKTCAGLQPNDGPEASPTPEPEPESDPGALPGPETSSNDGNGVYRIDGDSIRTVLDAGTDAVLELHTNIAGIQSAGGLTITIGNQHQEGRS